MMTAGLKRDIDRSPSCVVSGLSQREDLGVRTTEALMVAKADQPTITYNDRPHHGVWLDAAAPALGLGQGP